MSIEIRENEKGFQKLGQILKDAATKKSYLKIGILESKGGGKTEEGITLASIAAINEFGAPKANIPERSFLRAPFMAKRDEYVEILGKLLLKALQEKKPLDKILKLLGNLVVSDMRKYVTAGDQVPPPNTPSVIARKEAKGRHKGKQGPPKPKAPENRRILRGRCYS